VGHKRWSLLLIGLVFVGMLPFHAVSAPPVKGTHKVIVQSADVAVLSTLAQGGGKLLVDYGSFSLWQAPDIASQAVIGRASVAIRDDLNAIHLRGTTLDTTSGTAAPVAAAIKQTKASGKQFWMVQFVGPVKGAWLDNLKQLGIEIVAYVPNNAYVVWLDGSALTALESLATTDPTIQWTGAYHPEYRLAPVFRSAKAPQGSTMVPVTVQFYNTATVKTSVAAVRARGGTLFRQESILNLVNLSLLLPASQIITVASSADVFNVEPYVVPKPRDEVQGQIVAGNVTRSGGNVVPTGPGYLTFLADHGFPTDPSQYPIVAILDDGVDNGTTTPVHPDFYVNGDPTRASRIVASVNCTVDSGADGQDGHGNINAGIIGAYNHTAGAPYVDANGYDIGLGISPYGRLANMKVFRNNDGDFDESQCGGTNASTVLQAYNVGAAITSNSWGSDVFGAYDSDAQAYDSLTRDASSATAGNQQMLHVFAAGNAGPTQGSIGSPGTAKNVLAVAATESVRDNGIDDGCALADANNADDIADFSSRGPAADGRAKPDISAPGTHIQGPASQDPAGFDGLGVCGAQFSAPDPRYYPAGQTLYTWSSGTSHSTPAISGVASLVYNYYQRAIKPGQTPSPAMVKALILNNPRYLTGIEANDNLPSPNQGWGDADLKAIFDTTTHRYSIDQSTTFTNTGDTLAKGGTVTDGSKPLKVTLVWTDAPGDTAAGIAAVNNLNLEVTAGGNVYKGNVFSGQWSTMGGSADTLNNVENVFIPSLAAGTPFSVKVTAANLAGIAIPGAPGTTNQDFALVVSNGDVTPSASLASGGVAFSDSAPGGNGNGIAESGESIQVTIGLHNGGDATATAIGATLSTTTTGVVVRSANAGYPDIAPDATANNATAFTLALSPDYPCGQPIALSETVNYSGGSSAVIKVSVPTGSFALSAPATYTATDVPQSISASGTPTVTSNLAVHAPGVVAKMTVTVNISHTYDSDLTLSLISPTGTIVTLSEQNGSSNNDYTNTVFDDDAATLIDAGTPPFTGTFKPDTPLSALNGQDVNGTWQLRVADGFDLDGGALNSWSMTITPRIASCQAFAQAVTGVAITSTGTTALKVGQVVSLAATGTFANSTRADISNQVQWSSSDPTKATVDATGKVTALSPGATVTITATYQGVSGHIDLSIGQPTPIGISPQPAPSGRPSGASVGNATAAPTPNPIPKPRP
jgi:subtilisin-like proprotein convertase family protein